MTQKTVLLGHLAGILGAVNPASLSTGATSTGWISAANFQNFMAIVQTGLLGTSATVDAKIEQATTSSGTGAKDLTGSAITQIVKASGDNVQEIITFATDSLDIGNNYAFFRLTITVGTAASIVGAMVLGSNQRTGTIAAGDAASVKEIVTVAL